VGKRGGQQSIKQPEINALLVKFCLEVGLLQGAASIPAPFSRCSQFEIGFLVNSEVRVMAQPGMDS